MNLQISTNQLPFGTRGDDVVRVQQALQALGRSVPIDETAFVATFSQHSYVEQIIGKSPLNGAAGSYEISYQPSGLRRFDLRVEVRRGLNN